MKNNELLLLNTEDKGKYISAKRIDGLDIFLDKDGSQESFLLNHIRMTAPKDEVILAVGLIRGLQIARSYAKKTGETMIFKKIQKQIEQVCFNYACEGIENDNETTDTE